MYCLESEVNRFKQRAYWTLILYFCFWFNISMTFKGSVLFEASAHLWTLKCQQCISHTLEDPKNTLTLTVQHNALLLLHRRETDRSD